MTDSSKNADDLKELGNKAFAQKNYEEAIKHYSAAIKVDPTNHVFFSNRSASYGGLQKWKEACSDAKECIRLDPSFIKGYYRLATAQIELQDYDAAMATIRQGSSIDSNNPQLLKQMRTVRQLKKAQQQQTTAQPQQPAVIGGQHPQLDDATSRELQDLQQQFGQTNRELNLVQANRVQAQRQYKVHELTKSELENVPAENKCYRSIGKMFLLSTKDRVVDHLEKQLEEQKKKETDMTQKIDYLERRLKSQRLNIQELVAPTTSSA